ncbi:uncharacterized protein K489DRAFT_7739 [Dissoconium aciculare CBS 342.82]|uniref:Uncharacterized protein n=1 Tax=Dissoconium aciculare CBS 342.82 TaxID=1314786 RepID=A0A6J3MJM7_9PEZI|nr:uncharacterized protein K489DRAFT_7739 [Dissoconium aciculare CBS 342.82]KAF1827142.1 hypothetical protein K489DRAFT_7739 [Dissoconium aciculare CBS 342.82]
MRIVVTSIHVLYVSVVSFTMGPFEYFSPFVQHHHHLCHRDRWEVINSIFLWLYVWGGLFLRPSPTPYVSPWAQRHVPPPSTMIHSCHPGMNHYDDYSHYIHIKVINTACIITYNRSLAGRAMGSHSVAIQ